MNWEYSVSALGGSGWVFQVRSGSTTPLHVSRVTILLTNQWTAVFRAPPFSTGSVGGLCSFNSRNKHSPRSADSLQPAASISSTIMQGHSDSHKHSTCGPVWHMKPSTKYIVHGPHALIGDPTNKQTSSHWGRRQHHVVFLFGSTFQLLFIGDWRLSLVLDRASVDGFHEACHHCITW